MSESVTPGSGAVAFSRAARPPTGAIAARRVSGFSFHSTFRLSAPSDARNRVPPADARNQEKSKIRTPCRGNGLPRGERRGEDLAPGKPFAGPTAPAQTHPVF